MGLEDLTEAMNGQVLDLSPPLSEGTTIWVRLKELMRHQQGTLVQISLATLMLQSLALVMPELTGVVMNRALPNGAESTIQLVAIGVLLMSLFQGWIGWIRERALLYMVTRMESSTARGYLGHLLKLPFPFLQQKTLGDMLQAFGGLSAARELLTERALGAVLDGAMAVIFLVTMAIKLPAPTLVVALVALLMAGIAVLIGRSQARLQAQEVEAQARERGYLTELIAGVATVKAAGAEGQGARRWLERFQEELNIHLRKQRTGLWSEVGLGSIRQVLSVVLLIWGGKLVMEGGLQIGTLFAFMQLASGFIGSVFGVVSAYLRLMMLRPQLAKTQEILDQEPEPRELCTGGPAKAPVGPVVMENVWFRYNPEGPWILKGYNLRVEAGQKRSLTGPSGFGKSTILRLLAGLYEPEIGNITIGGQKPATMRHNILYLPQFVQLYGGSIIENLRVLSGGAPMEWLIEMARQTGLHDWASTLPMSYSTILPHGGRNLSGGQRQLIALTAVLASGRGLILLDEATAHMDKFWATSVRALVQGARSTAISASHEPALQGEVSSMHVEVAP